MILVIAGADWGIDAFAKSYPGGEWIICPSPADDDQLHSYCRRLEPRYVFFLNHSRYIPAYVFGQWECVNFHCAPLPYGRGGHPIENMILQGHTETTLTAHQVTTEIDAGPIYMQRAGISLAGSKAEILARFVEPVADMMREIVAYEPAPVPQRGEVVRFQRLEPQAYTQVWAGR